MRNRIPHLILALLTVLALGALGLSLAQSSPNKSVKVLLCGHQLAYAPNEVTIACADGNYGFSHVSWFDWGRPIAYAHATLYRNDCTPTCAAGKFTTRAVEIELYDLSGNRYHTLNGVGFNAGLDNGPVAMN